MNGKCCSNDHKTGGISSGERDDTAPSGHGQESETVDAVSSALRTGGRLRGGQVTCFGRAATAQQRGKRIDAVRTQLG